jgi:carbon-monoxide dehydrogenase medium subunit
MRRFTKYMGTAVGNLCVGTPASDVATVLTALDAELVIAGVNGERTEPISDFYVDYRRTSLKRGEMVVGVSLPKTPKGMGTAFFNLVRTHADIAKVIVAVALLADNGVCEQARIAVGSAAPTVFRATEAEALLRNRKVTAELLTRVCEIAADATRPITDFRSNAEYRKEMTRVLVNRALQKALDRARG